MSPRKMETKFFFSYHNNFRKINILPVFDINLIPIFQRNKLKEDCYTNFFYGLLKHNFYNTISLFKKGYVLLKNFKRNFCSFYEKLENLFWRQVTHRIDWNWCDTCKCMILIWYGNYPYCDVFPYKMPLSFLLFIPSQKIRNAFLVKLSKIGKF